MTFAQIFCRCDGDGFRIAGLRVLGWPLAEELHPCFPRGQQQLFFDLRSDSPTLHSLAFPRPSTAFSPPKSPADRPRRLFSIRHVDRIATKCTARQPTFGSTIADPFLTRLKEPKAAIFACEELFADTLERKVQICTRAYRLLTEEIGFPPEDIVFDPNVFAIATGIAEHSGYGIAFIEAPTPCARTWRKCPPLPTRSLAPTRMPACRTSFGNPTRARALTAAARRRTA